MSRLPGGLILITWVWLCLFPVSPWAQDAAAPVDEVQEECLACHGDASEMADLVDEWRPSLVVDGERFTRSIHSSFSCIECHDGYEQTPHDDQAESIACIDCHDDMAELLADSVHGSAIDGEPVDCKSCHGVHGVLPPDERESRLYPLNVPRTCGQCHFGSDAQSDTIEQLLQEPYTDDSHGEALLQKGLVVAATCVSCHGSHQIKAHGDPSSPLAHSRVDRTCGKCHVGLLERYERSVHHEPGADGGPQGATCVDCHKPHQIESTQAADFRLGLVSECGSCHEERAASFFDTVHGKSTQLGGDRAAKCQDCHGSHDIRPVADPESTLSPAHIVQTCSRCHEGAHASFARFQPHATHDDPGRWPWMFWTFWSMTALLVGTMGVALLHTLLFLVRLTLDRKQWQARHRALLREGNDQRLYRRFDRSVRSLHLLMIIAFLTLAMTGMALRFSYTAWAKWIAMLFGGQATLSMLHRMAALLLVGVFCWHLLAAFRAKRAARRSWLAVFRDSRSVIFNQYDLPELRQTLAWFFGRGPRPAYGRFTYWEKFDYFAVFWGVAIIGLTGFALWFPVQAAWIVPGWMLNIAEIIHGDEALLAVAFIFTVHFFNANLRPDRFPMDMTMFTGRMTVAELAYERPREYQDMVDAGELDKHIVRPLDPAAVRSFRVFATLALITGLSLITLIIYALLTY